MDVQRHSHHRSITSQQPYNRPENEDEAKLQRAIAGRTKVKKRVVAKPVAKKPAMKKQPVAKKPRSKPTMKKQPVGKKPVAKKPTPVAKQPVAILRTIRVPANKKRKAVSGTFNNAYGIRTSARIASKKAKKTQED